jgi:hypothetical protein
MVVLFGMKGGGGNGAERNLRTDDAPTGAKSSNRSD